MNDLVEEIIPLLTGLSIDQLIDIGYAVIDADSDRTVVHVRPAGAAQSQVSRPEDKGPRTRLLVTACERLPTCFVALVSITGATGLKNRSAGSRTVTFRASSISDGAFGGMGSLNDLVIAPVNDHAISNGEHSAVNARLDELRRELYELASYIRHHVEIMG